MSRYNCSLKYKSVTPGQKDPDSGFWIEGVMSDWKDGGRCHIEKHIPPKIIKGPDENVLQYTHEIFLPQSLLNLSIGSPIAIDNDEGIQIEEAKVLGIDSTGRKHIVIWA